MKTANLQLPPHAQVDTKKQIEGELKATRKELETTKKALKVQAARCRHLVTAFTRKLAEKDAEAKAFRELREKQLSSLLRALLVLEARLKREQKSIKVLLAEKDNIINDQRLEIERLKSLEKQQEPVKEVEEETVVEEKQEECREYAKPDLITSLGISDLSQEPDSLSSDSTRSCLGDENDYIQVKGVLNIHDRSAFSPISKKQEHLGFSPFSKSAPDISTGIVVEDSSDKYHDNPVLQCVNQILLKDQEDFLEERKRKDERDPRRHAVWIDEEDSPLDEEILEEESPKQKKSASHADLKDKIKNPPLPPKPQIQNKKVDFSEFHQIQKDVQLGIPLSILEPMDHGDKDLYVISNSALDDEIVKQLRGRTLDVTGLHIKHKERNQHSNVPTGSLHPNHHQPTKIEFSNNIFTPPKSVLKVNIQESPKRTSFGFKSPPKVGMPNMIKVASPVATLLTSPSSKEEVSPSVSQMVRRFEDLGTKKEGEEDEEKEKEETPAESSPSTVSYDNFLEATGLSQKSIITPSRFMTNHRNVTKPKDVKHRNKVRTSGVIERCIPPQVVGPTVKYWTEPFL